MRITDLDQFLPRQVAIYLGDAIFAHQIWAAGVILVTKTTRT